MCDSACLSANTIFVCAFILLLLLGAGIVTSLLVSLLGQARIYVVLGREQLLPSWFARVHPTRDTPMRAAVFTGCTAGELEAILQGNKCASARLPVVLMQPQCSIHDGPAADAPVVLPNGHLPLCSQPTQAGVGGRLQAASSTKALETDACPALQARWRSWSTSMRWRNWCRSARCSSSSWCQLGCCRSACRQRIGSSFARIAFMLDRFTGYSIVCVSPGTHRS